MVGIYADKGITGTSVKKRDDFNRLMRHCKQGKVDIAEARTENPRSIPNRRL